MHGGGDAEGHLRDKNSFLLSPDSFVVVVETIILLTGRHRRYYSTMVLIQYPECEGSG